MKQQHNWHTTVSTQRAWISCAAVFRNKLTNEKKYCDRFITVAAHVDPISGGLIMHPQKQIIPKTTIQERKKNVYLWADVLTCWTWIILLYCWHNVKRN